MAEAAVYVTWMSISSESPDSQSTPAAGAFDEQFDRAGFRLTVPAATWHRLACRQWCLMGWL